MLIGVNEQFPKWYATCGRIEVDETEGYCSEECSQYLDFDNIPDDWFPTIFQIEIEEEDSC